MVFSHFQPSRFDFSLETPPRFHQCQSCHHGQSSRKGRRFGWNLRLFRELENKIQSMLLLLMEDIRLTSWYGKYPNSLQGFIDVRWFAGFLNHQQYQVIKKRHRPWKVTTILFQAISLLNFAGCKLFHPGSHPIPSEGHKELGFLVHKSSKNEKSHDQRVYLTPMHLE